ncbi:MAG TPA: M23 family metallopeptidase [Frankiaceae bacterium]|jgi:murein DD-endopeptidase MepM/ murein hydrolase activator NlpD|nr:M23 family metallopeptidase [Frankiaceae bacterium]
MKRLLLWTFAAVLVLPVLLVAGGPSSGEQPTEFKERGGGGDEAQVSAAPLDLRPVFIAAARRFVLPPALLVAVAEVAGDRTSLMGLTASEWSRFGHGQGGDTQAQVDAAARLLLTAGAAGDGGWDAARGLAGYTATAHRVEEVLAVAAEYGYRYRPDGPPLDPDRYVFPLVGEASYGSVHHDYPATDIFTAIGTPVVAVTRSVVLRTSPREVGKGGITATLRGEDGWRYYYAHLSRLAAVRPGQVVEAGTLLGWSGNTGNARTTAPHLHFGISLYGQTAGEISPYPYLQA